MQAEEVVVSWLQGSGHTLEQAKRYLDSSKYQYLVELINKALEAVSEEVSEEEQLDNALKVLYAYPEVSTLVNVVRKKLRE